MQRLTPEETPVVIKNEAAEVRVAPVGELSVSFIRLAKGTDLGPALVGLPGDLCQCPHWGYMLEGRLKMRTADGDQIYSAGDAFYWGPGHAPEALEDCSYVDFSPTEAFAEVLRHIQGG
ncbi:MAG: hypothetical protein AB1679_16140 [Actinomycetota bacterium]|jgi:hypothetical protein